MGGMLPQITTLKFFFGNSPKGAGTQERACVHSRRQPTQVRKKPAHVGKSGVPRVQTLDSQVRTAATYQ